MSSIVLEVPESQARILKVAGLTSLPTPMPRDHQPTTPARLRSPTQQQQDRPLSLHASCPGDLRAAESAAGSWSGSAARRSGAGGFLAWFLPDDLGVVPDMELQSSGEKSVCPEFQTWGMTPCTD